MPVYPSGGTIAQSAGSPGFGPAPTPSFNASGSVRFNPADTGNFSFVPTIASCRTTFTWSGWVKRSLLGSRQMILSQYQAASRTDANTFTFEFNASDQLRVAGETTQYLLTSSVFRDASSWYHVQLAVDTTNATAANRVIVYVNGVRQATSAYTAPTQFVITGWGLQGVLHRIGCLTDLTLDFGGYLADVNYVDGLALTPSSFTSTDSNTGQLVPAQYTGAFGINGFYLPFSSAALAVDLGQNPKTTAQDYPYWPYNTLLVNTTNTNGAQNNTFLDSSTNNFTITRNGNTTQGNFTPFTFGGGTDQANGYYSGYFDGTGDYLTVANNAALDPNTDNFCMECWVYITGITGNNQGFNGKGVAGTSGYSFYITNALLLSFIWNGTGGATITGGTLSLNTWNHVAVVRNSGVIRLYLNGVGAASSTACTTDINSTNGLFIGQARGGNPILGNMSNYRMTKGTLPPGYDATATTLPVPTAPLTAISGTSLLTCQSSQFIDNSTNAFSINVFGNAQPIPANPFGMIDWSGYFDGTGDYITPAVSSAYSFGTNDFTIECWSYSNTGTNNGIFQISSSAGGFTGGISGIAVAALTAGWAVYYGANAQLTDIGGPTAVQKSAWTHIALVRQSSFLYLYINGVRYNVNNDSTNYTFTNLVIGGYYSTSYLWNGVISNFRIVKDTAVYTSNFTPPTAPLTAISGTSLLTCQSSTFIDNSTNALPITVNGNSYTGTLNNPFNNRYNYNTPPVRAWSFNSTSATLNNYISTPSSPNLRVDQGNYTIEFWLYLKSWNTDNRAIDTGANSSTSAWVFGYGANGYVGFGRPTTGTSVVSQPGVLSLNRWFHIVCTCSGAGVNGALYVDGVREAFAASFTATIGTSQPFNIGRNNVSGPAGWGGLDGYISNLRFVSGQQLYTSNFTPDTRPLTNSTYTLNGGATYLPITGTCQLLTCQDSFYKDNSINNFPFTQTGTTPNIQAFSPFIPTQSWSAASYGGSAYFDGTGDSIVTSTYSNELAFGTGDFTIEFWVYPLASSRQDWLDFRAASGTKRILVYYTGSAIQYDDGEPASLVLSYTLSSINLLNRWKHIAVTRVSGQSRLFVDGALVAGPVSDPFNSSVPFSVSQGRDTAASTYVTGYISNLRIVKGAAVYTSAFTPPTAPVTAVTNTQLLLNYTNSGIYDATGQNVIETVGNAQVTTAVKKFGESSMSFDGAGDYLVIPTTNAPCQFGTADFTVEGWIYPTIVTATQNLMGNRVASTGANNWDLVITSASKLAWGTTSTNYLLSTSSLLVNTWQHIAVSRVSGTTRMFVNGTLEATSTSSITLSANSLFNIGSQGTFNATTSNFNGYMQDVRISRGVGRYSGNFTPPAAAFAYNQYDIGNQQWLPTNISVTAGVNQDNLVDSPSDYGTDTGLGGQVRGNYATMSPIDTVGGTFANGNLNVGVTSAAGRYIRATIAPPSGKWYWEATVLSTTGTPSVGVVATTALPSGGVPVIGVTYSSNAVVLKDSTNLGTQTAWSVNNVVGIAYDADNLTIALYLNNALQTTVNLTTGYTYAPLFMSYANVTETSAVAFNFGQRAFSYTAPAGFKCLVSTNLPTVNGIGATSSTQASDYFDVALYTGTNATQNIATLGLQPDLVWIKGRSFASNHVLTDAVRGVSKQIFSSLTNAETTEAGKGVTAFNSNGFTLGPDLTVTGSTNASTQTYVAWNWKANGAGVANTDGTIPSTVSANTTNGCSIVTYTGTGANATVGHGLGVAPSFITIKQRNGTWSWMTYHVSLPTNAYVLLNDTAAQATSRPDVYNGAPSSTVINIGNNATINGSGSTYVAYCFAPVSGFSAMGSYPGNGSTDGPFVYTNFRPEFVMIKCSSAGSTFWIIQDGARSPSNAAPQRLFPNAADAEVATSVGDIDILSNGFKIRNTSGSWNTNAATYIYIAFAEFPFKYSRAR